MFTKKNFLSLLGLLALTFGVAACGKTSSTPKETGSAQPSVEVPTAEGKITFYFTLSSESAEIKDYSSIFLTGPMIGWKTGYSAAEMKKIEGKSVYYTQIDKPEKAEDWVNPDSSNYDFQLVLGYNKSSNMPDSVSGLQWKDEYKFTQETTGTSNPYYTWDGVANTINLGDSISFATSVAAPADPLQKVTFAVNLDKALPEGYVMLIAGTMNGWDTTLDAKEYQMTKNADGKQWTKLFPEIFAGDIEFTLILQSTEKLGEGDKIDWAGKVQDANYKFTIIDDHANSIVDILAEEVIAVDDIPILQPAA